MGSANIGENIQGIYNFKVTLQTKAPLYICTSGTAEIELAH
jgi:hypothetical protein